MDFAKINHCFTTAISQLAEQEIEAAQNIAETKFDPLAVLKGEQRPPKMARKGFVANPLFSVITLRNILDDLGKASEKIYWAAKESKPIHKSDIKKAIKEIDFVVKGRKNIYKRRGYKDTDFQKWAEPFEDIKAGLLRTIREQ